MLRKGVLNWGNILNILSALLLRHRCRDKTKQNKNKSLVESYTDSKFEARIGI